MSIKLYTDKTELFECNVALEGASIKESKLRAILKFDDKNLMVEGEIKSNGKGQILLPKLKNISEDGEVGKMELEVIAEDAYFQPYEETFKVVTSKKATVEVLGKESSKPKIVVEKITPETDTVVGDITSVLGQFGLPAGVAVKVANGMLKLSKACQLKKLSCFIK